MEHHIFGQKDEPVKKEQTHYLVFDTETSNIPRESLKPTDIKQARVCQLACLLLDEKFDEKESLVCYVKPNNGWTISEGAYNSHHISMDTIMTLGIDNEDALKRFFTLALQAEVLVCHNIRFDSLMLEIEVGNLKVPEDLGYRQLVSKWLSNHRKFCTMNACTDIVKAEFKGGRKPNFIPKNQKYKWPTLQEAYKHFFKEEFVDAHDALNDVRATARIFKTLMLEHLPS